MSQITSIPRVLIADDDQTFSRRLSDFLKERGFACKITAHGYEAVELIKDWKPQFVLYDMMLPEVNALGVLEKISKKLLKLPTNSIFMVTSGHNIAINVRACIHAGAADFIVKPCSFEDILSRLVFHSQKRKNMQDFGMNAVPADKNDHYLYLTELLLRKTITGSSKTGDLIFDLIQMQALATNAIRCSLIKTNHTDMKGVVLSSSDDRNFKGFELNLHKYPEVTAVLHTEKLVAIDNLSGNATMAKIQGLFRDISFNSMIVCPVWVETQIYGVVSTRLAIDAPPIKDSDIRFTQIMAHAVGILLQKDALEKRAVAA